MEFGVEYLPVLLLRGDIVAIDMRADGDTCHSIFFLNLFRSVPFGQGIVSPVLGECRINMFLAVIVELADLDLWDIMLSGICPYLFGIYLVLLRYLFGCIIFGYIDIILGLDTFIRFGFQHQLNVASADE